MSFGAMAERFIGMEVGPYRLAFELTDVRQILEMGGLETELSPQMLGVTPVSLAKALGQKSTNKAPALLLLDGELGPILCSVCKLRGIRLCAQRFDFPATATLLWPGLIRCGMITAEDGEVYFVLDKIILMAVIQRYLSESENPKTDLLAKKMSGDVAEKEKDSLEEHL